MIRILLMSVLLLTSVFFIQQGRTMKRSSDKPVYLSVDEIANNHETIINTEIESMYIPDSLQLDILKKDYKNIWAHLNHLYSSNNIIAGKEYYTEKWYKQICTHYNGLEKTNVLRSDIEHKLIIKNWSSDGLVCSLTDTDITFQYTYPDKSVSSVKTSIAMVLLFEGDHWRIDALSIIY